MKKQLLFSVALSLLTATGASAQDMSNYKYYDFSEQTWTDCDGMEWPGTFGYFNKVSANGKYAVGYDDLLGSGLSFMWNSENPGSIEIVNNDYNLTKILCDVTNDGMVVGGFNTPENSTTYPGYMTADGEWTALPVSEDYSTAGATENLSIARAVTPDGNYITGQYYIKMGEKESPLGGMIEMSYLLPVIWEKDGDTYKLTEYRDLGEAGKNMLYDAEQGKFVDTGKDVSFQTFYVYDISNDGKTIVGMNTAETGGQNPAFIRDGKLMQLYDCNNDATYTFNGGICNSIDANGNIYGYFVDDDMNNIYFIYKADGTIEYVDNMIICGTKDGTRFNQQTGQLYYTLDCSEDGSVIAGGTVVMNEMLGAYNAPALLLNDVPTGVDRVEAVDNAVSINYSGNVLVVTGKYSKAEVYSTTGALIANGGQGKAFNMEGQPAGAYIVKVTTANGVKSFKFAR